MYRTILPHFDAAVKWRQPVFESQGRPEVAILDSVEYRIIRAVMSFCAHEAEIDVEAGLPDRLLPAVSDPQDRHRPILAHDLAGSIRLGRAARLLDLSRLDLRTRFLRLDSLCVRRRRIKAR
jgi:hypothetical protein